MSYVNDIREGAIGDMENEIKELRAENERMREALMSFLVDADAPPTECPRRLDYDWSDGDIAYEIALKDWVGEQIAREGLGLPYLKTGGE